MTYWINPPGDPSGEDVFGYDADPEIERKHKVRLPLLTTPTGRPRKFNPSMVLADAVILPRDYDSKKKKKLAHLKKIGAADVPLPPGARTSFMSLNRHVATTAWGARRGAPSLREQIERELDKRKLVVYLDRDANEPLRVAISPPFTDGQIVAMFRKAGYTPRDPKNANRPSVGSLGLLTETSKMGCYSFNLPAGPPKLGGTCPAATVGFMYSTMGNIVKAQRGKRDRSVEISPEMFICNGCYAIKNAYGNPSTVLQMQVRKYLVTRLMKNEGVPLGRRKTYRNMFVVAAEDYAAAKPIKAASVHTVLPGLPKSAMQPLTMSFSELAIAAISEARARVRQRRKKLQKFGYSAAEYRRTEKIANWLVVRKRVKTLCGQLSKESDPKKRRSIRDEISSLKKAAGAASVSELTAKRAQYKNVYADWQLPDPGYFRIHDAGDMFSDAYFRAWLEVCRYFSKGREQVQFWAPTRMWAFAGGLRDESLKLIPHNLALRPSTLHFRDESPSAHYLHSTLGLPSFKKGKGGGLSAPSGSAPEKPSEKDYKCPAYEHWTAGGGAIRLDPRTQKAVGGTCITARGPNREKGCRVCWNGTDGRYHDIVVFYEEH